MLRLLSPTCKTLQKFPPRSRTWHKAKPDPRCQSASKDSQVSVHQISLARSQCCKLGSQQHSRRKDDSVQILKHWNKPKKHSSFGLVCRGKERGSQAYDPGNDSVPSVQMDSGGVEPRLWYFLGLDPCTITSSLHGLGEFLLFPEPLIPHLYYVDQFLGGFRRECTHQA